MPEPPPRLSERTIVKTTTRSIPVLLSLLATPALQDVARADWPADGLLLGTPATQSALIGDGVGGVFAAWNAGGTATAQHVSGTGEWLMDPNGRPLGAATIVGDCVPDGDGGVFVPFAASGSVWLVRLGSTGNEQWSSAVCTASGDKQHVYATPDGAGGILVAWSDRRPLPAPMDALKGYCQRVDALGNALWTADGVLFAWESEVVGPYDDEIGVSVYVNGIAPGETGSAHIVYTFLPGVSPTDRLVLARIDSDGIPSNYTVLANYYLDNTPVVSAGSGVAYVFENRFLHRVEPDGSVAWTATVTGAGTSYRSAEMGSDGPLLAWTASGTDIQAQKVSMAGIRQWGTNGVVVCDATGIQTESAIASDHAGGAVVAWSDRRSGEYEVYLQHVDALGLVTLTTDGVPVSTVAGDHLNVDVHMDPDGYAILSWENAGLYAQRYDLTSATDVSHHAGATILHQNFPNPFNPSTTIRVMLQQRQPIRLVVYDVAGRHVRMLAGGVRGPGTEQFVWDGRDERGNAVASGVYFYRLITRDIVESKRMVLLK